MHSPFSIATVFSKILMLVMLGMSPASATESATEEVVQPVLSPLQVAVKTELERRQANAPSKAATTRLNAIADHYSETEYNALWMRDGIVIDRAETIVDNLARASDHGLHAADYDVVKPLAGADANELARFELDLSTKLVAYAQHLNAGRLNPRAVSKENVIYPEAIGAGTILKQASTTLNTVAYLRLLAPKTPRYERLRQALLSYRKLALAGGWSEIPKGEVLKPGMEDERVPLLRQRLAVSGDYAGDRFNSSTLYDGDIIDAVIAFQSRHGLEEDGVVGPNTLKEINVSVEERIAIMEYNLERRRWMQDDYGPYYVFANLADQVLKVVKNEKTIHAELIQVGLPYHRTPVFTDEMEYIEINPYWNVPYSIATKELLPELKVNPGKYAAQNYEVVANGSAISPMAISWGAYSRSNFPFRIRQRPGKGNALGRIKFMFPNKFNVYIHDTPSKSKFNRASRYFSHGCLRLKNPLKMAEVILADQNWTRAKIDAVVASKKRRVVKLDRRIPVHIAYMTAWVNKDGSVHFRRDVYGRDVTLGKALERIQG